MNQVLPGRRFLPGGKTHRAIGSFLGVMLAAVLLDAVAVRADVTPDQVFKTTSLLGSYLAGRIAREERDAGAATDFYRQALARDPDNQVLLEQAFEAEIDIGNFERVATIADKIAKNDPANRLARLFLGVKSYREGNYVLAGTMFKESSIGPIGELTATLARAWNEGAQKDLVGANEELDVLKTLDWAKFYRLYHRAQIASFTGDNAGAEATFAELFKSDPRIMSIATNYARFRAAGGDNAGAKAIIDQHIAAGSSHPLAVALALSLKKGEPQTIAAATANAGLADVFYGLGEALASEGGIDVGTIYLQLSLFLDPDQPLALAALASVQEQTKQYERAIATYDRIPSTSPISFQTTLRKAQNLNALDKVDEAKAALDALLAAPVTSAVDDLGDEPALDTSGLAALSRLQQGVRGDAVKTLQGLLAAAGYPAGEADGAYGKSTVDAVKGLQKDANLPINGVFGPQTKKALQDKLAALADAALKKPGRGRAIQINTAIGNILRGRLRFEEAANYYSAAIGALDPPTKAHWNQFYSRGVCYERLGQWDKAEADFLKALELDGEQALVLNYLGYSWVDKGLRLAEAMDHIRKAVKLKPDDGYFVDSLGWAHYRLGEFAEAAKQLERAVELKPDDPVINDHLGDAYWRVGRQLEARFQWTQSLSLKPEAVEIPKIEAKIKSGLDAAPGAAETDPQKKAETGLTKTEPVQ